MVKPSRIRSLYFSRTQLSVIPLPVFSTVFAFLILGEVPRRGQWIGGSITLFGIGIALVYKLMEKERVVLQKPIGFPGN
jgi:drug/metabolite transporter (DMT)-like permease